MHKKDLKKAFIDHSLRPRVKGGEYDTLEPIRINSKKISNVNLSVYNKPTRKKIILSLIQQEHLYTETSTGKLVTLLKQFFPKTKDYV